MSAVLISILIVFSLPLISFLAMLEPDTDISHYAQMKELNSGNDGLMAHFPNAVPREARDAKFSSSPAFLQGGASCQLQFTAPRPYIRAELARYLARAKQVQHGSRTSWGLHEIPTTSFDDWPGGELPEDFTIIVIEAKPYRPENWNHGYSAGIAGSLKRGQIIYWAENG